MKNKNLYILALAFFLMVVFVGISVIKCASNFKTHEEPKKQTDSVIVTYDKDAVSDTFKQETQPKTKEQVEGQTPVAKQETQHVAKRPIDIIESIAKKYKLVGVWDAGSYAPGKRIYKTIARISGKYYYCYIDIENEKLETTDEVLRKISINEYQGDAAYDMPERLVIDGGGNLNTYVYNPDVDEWVFMGMNVRVY